MPQMFPFLWFYISMAFTMIFMCFLVKLYFSSLYKSYFMGSILPKEVLKNKNHLLEKVKF